MNYNFTDRVRKVLAMAREEAIRLQHDYVAPEHILLGLVREGNGVAVAVLRSLEIDLDKVRERVEESVQEGGRSTAALAELPYTAAGKKVLEHAMMEAHNFTHAYVGTEHLLLGVIREGKGIGSQVLVSFDLTLERARAETTTILGTEPREDVPTARAEAAATARRIGAEPVLIWVFPGEATTDDLADVYAAVSAVYRASGGSVAPVSDVDALSEARDDLVEAIEKLRLKGGDLRLKPLQKSREA